MRSHGLGSIAPLASVTPSPHCTLPSAEGKTTPFHASLEGGNPILARWIVPLPGVVTGVPYVELDGFPHVAGGHMTRSAPVGTAAMLVPNREFARKLAGVKIE